MFLYDKIRMKLNGSNETIIFKNADDYQQRLSTLTTLEYKVFILMREGFTRKECSQRLNIKRREVNTYFKTVLKRLDVRSLAELIVNTAKRVE